MSLETIVNDLVTATDALHASITDKRTVLDNAAQQAAASLATTKGLQTQAEASAATAAAKATEATNNATQIAAYKTAAAALDTSTTATAAVTNLLPDLLAKKDPARHPFRKKMPTLVLDFERQKCHRYSPSTGFGETPLLPFMTFARNSSATYTGPDGLIKTAAANEARYDYDPLTGECKGLLVEESRTNAAIYSDKLKTVLASNNCFVIGYAGVAPDGTLNACRVNETAVNGYHQTSQILTVTVGVAYVLSAYFKAGERTKTNILAYSGGQYRAAGFDLSAGTVVTNTCGCTQADDAGIQSIGAGWYRAWIKVTPLSAYMDFRVTPSNNTWAYQGDSTMGFYVWGMQAEVGSFPTSYIPTPATFTGRASTATYLDANGVVQTAASGVARSNAYDYDSDGVLRPIGLLLEASATNQLLYSEQFDNAAWTKNAGGTATAPVVTANYGAAPDGQTTAYRVVFALNAGQTITDMSDISQGHTTVAGTTYTQSVWLKTTDGSTKVLQLSFNGENRKLITITGTWQRFSNTGIASDTIRGFRLALRGTTGTSDSADLLVWGAQQGVGSYPTSYIPTTSAQVTRAADTSTSAQATRVADDAKVDGTKFSDFYNQSQGTIVGTFAPQGLGGSGALGVFDVSANAAAGSDRFGVIISDGAGDIGYAHIRSNNVYIVNHTSDAALLSGVKQRCAMSVSTVGESSVFNAAKVASSAYRAPSTMILLKVGKFDGYLNGHVARISYYPQPFTNEELQAATSA